MPEDLADGAVITFEGVLLTDPKPFGELLRLPVRVVSLDGVDEFGPDSFTVDVLADRLSSTGDSGRSVFEFRYGDRYRITGVFDPDSAPDRIGFVRRPIVELVGEGEGNALRRGLARVRTNLSESIRKSLPEPVAGLAAAVTVGDRTGLSGDTREAFRESGTAHFLAISGLHIAIVGVAAFALATRVLGRQRQLYLLVPLVAVWGYAVLAGLSEPATRAAIMATVYIAARAAGRQRTVLQNEESVLGENLKLAVGEARAFRATLPVPEKAPFSYRSMEDKISWTIHVALDVEGFGELRDELEVMVAPG